MMTREDVLRELELLPVWTLRTPLVSQLPAAPTKPDQLPVADEPTAIAEQLAEQVAPPESLVQNRLSVTPPLGASESTAAIIAETVEPQDLSQLQPQLLPHMLNEDGDCMFVFAAAQLQADEAALLRNIVMAMAMKTKAMAAPANISERVKALKPKLLITLGETTAQYLLQSTLPLADLRGIVHPYQGVALVASYDLDHLLQVLPDKALAWDDFCLGLNALQSLKSAD